MVQTVLSNNVRYKQFQLQFKFLKPTATSVRERRINSPLGLILCSEGSKEQIELLQLGKTGIKVAEYITELPDKKLLRQKLQLAIEISKRRLELGDVQ